MLFNNSPISENPTPPGELTGQELELGYWYFIHKPLFRKIITISLIVLTVVVWGNLVWRLADYLMSTKQYEEMLNRLATDPVEVGGRESYKPQAVEIGSVQVAKSGTDSYDLTVLIKNPNSKWGLPSFDYKFIVEGEEFVGQSFLLPEESKYISVYNVRQNSVPANSSLTIDNSTWVKVVPADTVLRVPEFKISNEEIEAVTIGSAQGYRLRANLQNASPYNFWDARTTALLFRANKLVGVAEQKVRQINAGEDRVVEFTWLNDFGVPDAMKIVAEANTFEPSNISAKKF
ncbi:MAG: hypothetical protein AAB657_02825 [Patescibacteria group bacterium]